MFKILLSVNTWEEFEIISEFLSLPITKQLQMLLEETNKKLEKTPADKKLQNKAIQLKKILEKNDRVYLAALEIGLILQWQFTFQELLFKTFKPDIEEFIPTKKDEQFKEFADNILKTLSKEP